MGKIDPIWKSRSQEETLTSARQFFSNNQNGNNYQSRQQQQQRAMTSPTAQGPSASGTALFGSLSSASNPAPGATGARPKTSKSNAPGKVSAVSSSAANIIKALVDDKEQIVPGRLYNWLEECQQSIQDLCTENTLLRMNTKAPVKPTITFSAKTEEDWEDFREAYCNDVSAIPYNEHYAKHYLKGCMRGAAFKMISHVNFQNMTFADMLKQYDAIFLSPASSQMARQEYAAAHQQPKETLQAYHGRLKALYNRAYPNYAITEVPLLQNGLPDPVKQATNMQAEENLTLKFVQSINQKRVRTHILEKQPKSYDDALQAALHITGVIVGEIMISGLPGMQQARVAAYGEPMDISALAVNALDPNKTRCFICRNPGHISANCKQRKFGFRPTFKPTATFKSFPPKKPYQAPKPKTSGKPFNKFVKRKPWENKPAFKRFIQEMLENGLDEETLAMLDEEEVEAEASQDQQAEEGDEEELTLEDMQAALAEAAAYEAVQTTDSEAVEQPHTDF